MSRGNFKASAASAAGRSGGFGGFGSTATSSSLSYLAEPPSFVAVSDPQVVVALKNVLKKDSTTKSKALEELVAYTQAHPHENDGGVEDAILDVWVKIYPRTSIDNSRRVRELSHNLQLELLKSTRKRMERLLSGIVATWLAGLFDRDRVVARAASTGLSSFLQTPEKMNAFWRKCQPQIIEFAIEAIQETQDSLSDERSTTQEDAIAKHQRVIHASLCLVHGLLQRINDEDLTKLQGQYETYFEEDAVWASITSSDPSIRKAVCHVLFACLDRKLPYADSAKTRQAFVTGGLKTNQSGSALEFIRALTKLTESQPQIWTQGKEKKSPVARLQAFIAKGSQGSPPKFWEYLDQLVQAIPEDTVSLEQASSLLTALKSGITHREEPRTNTSYAWKCYIDTAKRLLTKLSDDNKVAFAALHLFPFFDEFIFAPSGSTVAIPTGPNAMGIFVEAHVALARGSPDLRAALSSEWKQLADKLCANIAALLPEVSKEFKQSQDRVGEEGRRWFALVGEIKRIQDQDGGDYAIETVQPSVDVIMQAMKLLQDRNMKPFGAGQVLEFALSTSRHLFEGDLGKNCLAFLSSTPENNMLQALESPASPYLLSSLRILRSIPSHYEATMSVWTLWINEILALPATDVRNTAIASMISSEETAKSAQEMPELLESIVSQIIDTAKGNLSSWDLIEAALTYKCLTSGLFRKVVLELLQLLKTDLNHQETLLRAIAMHVKADPAFFSEDEAIHTDLVGQLFGISENSDADTKTKASGIRVMLEQSNSGHLPIVGVVQSNLESAGPQSVSVETLALQAQEALKSGASTADIFPNTNTFLESLSHFFTKTIDPSLAIIAGDTALLPGPAESSSKLSIPRDSEGRSVAVRMSLYLSHLLEAGVLMSELPLKFQVELLYLHGMSAQLVSEQISTKASDGPWKSLSSTEATSQAMWLVSSSKSYLSDQAKACTSWSASNTDIKSTALPQLLDLLVEQSSELTSKGFYSSRLLTEVIEAVVEANGIPDDWEQRFLNTDTLKSTPQKVLIASSIIYGARDALQSSKAINNFCNRLVSDVAGAKAGEPKTFALLSLLTACGQVYAQGELPVANNRIIFAVKQITGWFEDEQDLEPLFAGTALRCLGQLLPCMKDVYGSYWEKTLEFCVLSWNKAHGQPLNHVLPLLHSSLKLTRLLESIEDPNDDLVDALNEFSKQKAPALLELLRLDREVASQPLEIVDAMLCREVAKLEARQIPEPEELFGLVASESKDIQTAAFTLLHKAIPAAQEQKAVDALLDKTDARLPDELLSLLLDAPTLEKYSDAELATFPTPIRSYLLSWSLLFDHYTKAPSKIQTDFTAHLRSENHLSPLLDFTFDVLGHSAAHPLNLAKAQIGEDQIRNYDLQVADSEPDEKNMQLLLVHLYYLVLRYTPGLFRQWYLDLRSKQTRIAVESWTETYFSPILTSDALDEVSDWSSTQSASSSGPDDQPLLIKVSKAAKEITAGYEIDESTAAISLQIPPSFPIAATTVTSLRRVAVSEKKWQSWVLTTQAVITFSNGNIIDGLSVFKRNITAALKGQTECAICYSVIDAAQRMPDKRCGTCKNMFHRGCLYKWFQTSSQNTCPLCRNPIDYLGADTQKRRQ